MLHTDSEARTVRGVTGIAVLAAGVLLLGLAACSGSPNPDDGAPAAAAPDSVRGTVRQVGSSPFVRTVVEGSDTVTVTGELEAEISRLSGARVLVAGTLASGDYPGPRLEAASYEILSVDGRRPVVGVLAEDDQGLYLDRGESEAVRLRAVSSGLANQIGGKVWVVTGEDGSVQRYGILRPPEQ